MKKFTAVFLCLVLFIPAAFAAEAVMPAEEDAEQGLSEIQPLLKLTDVREEEGMSLEEITAVFSGTAMSEYMDSATGFSMQYPAVFVFDEEAGGNYAATADGLATLSIDHIKNDGSLDEVLLSDAIRLETPNAEIRKNEQNGCLRVDRISGDGKQGQTDLYLLTEHCLHHILLRYPAEEQGTYFSYIEYMINTMETDETDLG